MSVDKGLLLQKLKEKEEADPTLPLKDSAHTLVFGEGNPDADILFLGEAPGKNEDLTGRPFCGQAGKVLDKLLESIKLNREDVFITSVLHYRPPDNRDPFPQEIESFSPYIDKEIEIIDPKVIITLGRFSLNKFLPDVKISQVHGKPQEIQWHGKKVIILPLYHPAAALRRGSIMEILKEDFAKVANFTKQKDKLPHQQSNHSL